MLPHQDSNLESWYQKPECCQLHHGALNDCDVLVVFQPRKRSGDNYTLIVASLHIGVLTCGCGYFWRALLWYAWVDSA